jgi:hypothetical protein
MAEVTPNPAATPADPASNMPLTPPTKASAPAPAKAAPAKGNPESGKDADLKRLGDLEKEYLTLKDEVSKASQHQNQTYGEKLSRKGEVVREMDAIKRKHDLP